MQWPDQMPGAENAAWRMGVAERAAGVHAGNRNLAALAVAGSVGADIADRFSDLELDCYWVRPPTDADRLAPVRALGGELTALWDYDQDDQEWSEDYLVGELGITVSNFLVSSVEQFLDDVLVRANTDPVRHMRLVALQRCRPLLGAEMMASWRARADTCPRTLVSALVQQALAPEVLAGWSAREALVSRGDDLAVRDLLTKTGLAAVRAILALNRVYLPHRQLKWQHHLTTGLRLVPDRLAERLESLSNGQPGEALQAAETLLAEIVTLARMPPANSWSTPGTAPPGYRSPPTHNLVRLARITVRSPGGRSCRDRRTSKPRRPTSRRRLRRRTQARVPAVIRNSGGTGGMPWQRRFPGPSALAEPRLP